MKVLIISINQTKTPLPVMPVGACFAAEAALRSGHEVKFLDFMFKNNPLKNLSQTLVTFRPEVIGISVRNIDNNDMQNPIFYLKDLPPVMKNIRNITIAPVILGGAAVSIMPEEILRYTGASFALAGENVSIFSQLLEKISKKELPVDLPGVMWLSEDKCRKGKSHKKKSIDTYLLPDYHKWIDIKAYRSSLAAMPVKTKSGCDFDCVYCTYSMIDGKKYELYNPETVIEAIKKQVISGFKDFEFVDNVFNAPKDHAMAICEEIVKSGIHARFQTLELNPLFLDEPLMKAMEQAGFKGIGITIESASEKVLSGLRKSYTVNDIHIAAKIVRHHNIPCIWLFMLGGPGETDDTINETLRFACENIRPCDVAYFTLGIRVYPGAYLDKIARKEGILSVNSNKMLEPLFYVSPDINTGSMIHKVKSVINRKSNFILAGETGFKLMPLLISFGQKLGIRPPIWRYTRFFKKIA